MIAFRFLHKGCAQGLKKPDAHAGDFQVSCKTRIRAIHPSPIFGLASSLGHKATMVESNKAPLGFESFSRIVASKTAVAIASISDNLKKTVGAG